MKTWWLIYSVCINELIIVRKGVGKQSELNMYTLHIYIIYKHIMLSYYIPLPLAIVHFLVYLQAIIAGEFFHHMSSLDGYSKLLARFADVYLSSVSIQNVSRRDAFHHRGWVDVHFPCNGTNSSKTSWHPATHLSTTWCELYNSTQTINYNSYCMLAI